MTPLAIASLRHIGELSAFLLLFVVGVSLIAAFVLGLLIIWGNMWRENEEAEQLSEERLMHLSYRYAALSSEPDVSVSQDSWLEGEPFSGLLGWSFHVPAFPYDWAREGDQEEDR